MPAAIPVTIPVAEPTVPFVTSLLLHTPPTVASLNTVVAPTHTTGLPEIATGVWLTVTACVAIQPAAVVNVIIELPAVRPVYIPVPAPMVATVRLLLDHVPEEASVTVAVAPVHTASVPPIAAGNELTVTGAEIMQPVAVTA